MITFEGVTAGYDGHIVMKEASFTLSPGATALMAPSGYGKTTALYLLARLLRPIAGEIKGLPEGGAAMVFQEDRLLPWKTALENALSAKPSDGEGKATDTLKRLGLKNELHEYPGQLSGGMKRRVALARALTAEKRLLLLDEPFKGLDEDTRARAAKVILDEKWDYLIISTHDEREAELLNAGILRLTDYF